MLEKQQCVSNMKRVSKDIYIYILLYISRSGNTINVDSFIYILFKGTFIFQLFNPFSLFDHPMYGVLGEIIQRPAPLEL